MLKFLKISKVVTFCKNINFNHFSKFSLHTVENSMGKSFAFNPVTLTNIKDNEGARKEKTRWGRGPGSGKGKTSGRGHKGYKARVGNPHLHFEGGQTPITRRLPKFGFRRSLAIKENYTYVNLDKIIYLVLKGKLDSTKTITVRDLYWSGAISKVKNGVKLLSRGSEMLKEIPPLHLEVSSASQRAIDEVKKLGGKVSSVYRTPLTLKYLIKPWKFVRQPLDPVPPFKKTLKLMKLEEKGIEVKYNKPKWTQTYDLKRRAMLVKKRADAMHNAHLLPEYPIKISPHMSDNKLRERKPMIWKKINFSNK